MQKFTKTIGQARAGVSSAIGTFAQLGISTKDIANDSTHQLLLKSADGIAKLGDSASRSAPEVALLGKTGQQFDTIFSGGSKGILELTHAAEDLGIVLSHDQIENADRTADKISELKQVFEANIAKGVADNASAIYDFVDALEKMITKIPDAISWLKQLQARAEIATGYSTLAGGYLFADSGQRAEGRASIQNGNDKLDALQAADTRRHPPEFIRKQLDAIDNFGSDRKGGSYTDPGALAAAAAARKKAAEEAARAAKEAARNQAHFDSELGRSQSDILSLNSDLTADLATRNENTRQQIETERRTKNQTIQLDDKLSAAQKAQLTALNDDAAKLQLRKINYTDELAIDKESVEAAQDRLNISNDVLDTQRSLARTAQERQQIELKLLANARAAEEAKLKPYLDDESRAANNRHYSQAEIDSAKRQSAGLDAKYNGQAAVIANNNQGPLAAYLDGIPQSAAEINESLQNVATSGLDKLNEGLTAAITGTGTLKGAFKSLATSIVADLAKIVIEQAVIKPLASALLGGSTGGGGGFLSSIFGSLFGKRANGGITQPGDYLIGERGPELMSIGATANIVPNSRIGAANDNRAMSITSNVYGVNDPAQVRALSAQSIMQATPAILKMSSDQTTKDLNRPRMR